MRLRVLLVTLALAASSPAAAQIGPPQGSAPFRPQVGFNPACAHKPVPPPVPGLLVNAFEHRVFGYTRYCALPHPQGVQFKVSYEITNGNKTFAGLGDGDTLCFRHVWVKADGQPLWSTARRWGVEAGKKRLEQDTFVMSQQDASEVAEWRWSFSKCDRYPDKLICRGAAAVVQTAVEGYFGFKSPADFANVCR